MPLWSACNWDLHLRVRLTFVHGIQFLTVMHMVLDKCSLLGALALTKAQYGEGYGPVYLDELNCNGTESSIMQCGHSGVANANCHHAEDASVICKGKHMSSWYISTSYIVFPSTIRHCYKASLSCKY